ncbi:MAG: hypothetical protein MJK04_08145, partial [Psychrosphaera sp.]|nr:hypothetical protein [Psychrosphaera sp.]
MELGEVESQLEALEAVDSAFVAAKTMSGSQQLVGYVKPQNPVLETDIAAFATSIKALLGQQLPEYMVPGILMVVDRWPLTPNGKVDKKALPKPDAEA